MTPMAWSLSFSQSKVGWVSTLSRTDTRKMKWENLVQISGKGYGRREGILLE